MSSVSLDISQLEGVCMVGKGREREKGIVNTEEVKITPGKYSILSLQVN